jgi:hypothetical protein
MGIVLLLAGTARADVVVPNSVTSVEGDGTFALTTTGATGRTYQMTIASGQLTGQVGQQITGLQWRLNGPGTAAWPVTDANFASWDIFVGPGVTPASMSNAFASNYTGPVTQVRSGPLTFTAGSFNFGSSPNPFGPVVTFTTPYLYTGGDLTIELRFTQQTGATTQSPLDGVLASGGPGNGWGVDFAARFAAGSTATTATTNGNFVVTNLVTTGVPEPTSLALAGISFASIAFWKKLRRRQG